MTVPILYRPATGWAVTTDTGKTYLTRWIIRFFFFFLQWLSGVGYSKHFTFLLYTYPSLIVVGSEVDKLRCSLNDSSKCRHLMFFLLTLSLSLSLTWFFTFSLFSLLFYSIHCYRPSWWCNVYRYGKYYWWVELKFWLYTFAPRKRHEHNTPSQPQVK